MSDLIDNSTLDGGVGGSVDADGGSFSPPDSQYSILDDLWWKDWYLNHMADLDIQLGTVEDDHLLGLSEDDLLFGDLGADRIIANNGDDLIDGGAGSDIIFAGGGDDFVFHRISENIGSIDFANGAGGHDILVIGMDKETLIDEATLAAITADFMEVMGTGKKFNFADYDLGFDFNLTAMNFEELYFYLIPPPLEAFEDNFEVAEDCAQVSGKIIGNVLANDTDGDDNSTLLVKVAPDRVISTIYGDVTVHVAANGDVTLVAGQDVLNRLAEGESLDLVFNYILTNADGDEVDPTPVTITVTGQNDAPVAVSDAASTDEDHSVIIDVLANDTDVDNGAVLTINEVETETLKGTVKVEDNKIVFDPGDAFNHLNVGESEVVSITYTIVDEHGAQSSATLEVTVDGVNDAPVAVADAASTDEDHSVTIDVLANDTDIDNGAVLTINGVETETLKGTVSVVENKIVFDPGDAFNHLNVGESEVVSITYTIVDEHGAQSSATLEVTVDGVDAPVANDDALGIDARHATMIDVLANDSLFGQEDVVIVSVGLPDPDQGLVRIVDNKILFYPLAKDFDNLLVGQTRDVAIEYTIKDSLGHESTATLTVTVQGHAIDDGTETTNQGEYNAYNFVGDLTGGTDNDTYDDTDDTFTLNYNNIFGDIFFNYALLDTLGDDKLESNQSSVNLTGDLYYNLYEITNAGHDVLTAFGESSQLIGDVNFNSVEITNAGHDVLTAYGDTSELIGDVNINYGTITNAGHDVLTASGEASQLIGDVNLNSGEIIYAGHDVLTASDYSSQLYGDVVNNQTGGKITNAGNDVLTASGSYSWLYGDVHSNSGSIVNCGDDILTALTYSGGVSFLIGDVYFNSGTIEKCGDDILIGGIGNDYMTGDISGNNGNIPTYGNDTFVFDLGSSIGNDTIIDFGNGNDILELHNVDLTDVQNAISGNVLDFGALVGTITLDGFAGTLEAVEVDGNIIVSIL